jgi:hypothetical protein
MAWYSYAAPNENFRKRGRTYAIATLAVAWTPPESKNRSTDKPNKKLRKINSNRLLLMGYRNIKMI